MPKFKITEFRTTPTIYVVEAKTEQEALDIFDEQDWTDKRIVCIGTNDDIEVEDNIEEIQEGEEVTVEYPLERN